MLSPRYIMQVLLRGAMVVTVLSMAASAGAHCDTMDGPVIPDARAALEQGNLAPALKWIGSEDEAELKAVFQQVLAARKQGDEAREVADRLFFETLVRLHRASEGEPYTGLKPAGQPEHPAVEAADRALDQGSAEALAQHLAQALDQNLKAKFEQAHQLKKRQNESPEAGRAYVAAYVDFVHYAKGVALTIEGAGGLHGHGAAEAASAGLHAAPAASQAAHAGHDAEVAPSAPAHSHSDPETK